MTEFDPRALEDLLGILKHHGVVRFSGFGVELVMPPGPEVPRETAPSNPTPIKPSGSGSVWEDPSLWPAQGGKRLRLNGEIE